MNAKTSKETADREKACRFLLAAFFRHGLEIGQKLVEIFQPHQQEGDPEPGFYGTIVAFGRGLKNAIEKVVRADKVLFAANAALDAARQSRDDKASHLGSKISALRNVCKALFVDLSVHQLGFDQRTAQDPVPLLIQADRVVEHLRSDEATTAEYRFEGDDFDPRKYADEVAADARGVRDSLDEVADTGRRAETALLEKRGVTKEYDRLFLHGARTFESHCRLVGKNDLAERIRPSEKRPGRTVVAPTEVPDDQSEEPEAEQSAAGEVDTSEQAVEATASDTGAEPTESVVS